MTTVRTLDAKAAQKLVEQLIAVPVNDSGEYAGAMARWLRDALLVAIPRAETSELAVLAAMSGAASGDGAAVRGGSRGRGRPYRLDLGRLGAPAAAAACARSRKARRSTSAIELASPRARSASEKLSLDDAQGIVDALDVARRRHPAPRRPERRRHDAAWRLGAAERCPRR